MSVNNFECKSLRYLLNSLESGSRPRGGVSGIKDGIPSIGAEHLTADGGFCFDKIRFIPIDYADRLWRGLIKRGDVLVVKDGATTGKVSYVDDKFPFQKSYVNEHVFICRASADVIGKFLYYYLRSKDGNSQIMSTFHGAAQGGISSSFASEVSVPVPTISIQQITVDKLDDLLHKIMAVKARLENLVSLQTQLMRSTSDTGQGSQSPSKLGDYVSECTESIGSQWHSMPKIGVSKDDGVVELRTSKQTGFDRYKIVRKGYLVYNPMRVNIGSIALYDKDEIAITSPDYVVFKTTDGVPPVVILSFLKSPQGLMEINNNTQGAVRERLYFNQLCNISIAASLIENAAKYGPVFEWFHKFNSLKPKIEDKLSRLEQSILAKAFKGELTDREPVVKQEQTNR